MRVQPVTQCLNSPLLYYISLHKMELVFITTVHSFIFIHSVFFHKDIILCFFFHSLILDASFYKLPRNMYCDWQIPLVDIPCFTVVESIQRHIQTNSWDSYFQVMTNTVCIGKTSFFFSFILMYSLFTMLH